MATKVVINWRAINPIVSDTLNIIQGTYPNEAIKFLDWYEKKNGSQESIYSLEIKNWIKEGIPYVRTIVNILSSEIKTRDQRLLRTLMSPGRSEDKIMSTSQDRSTIKGLREYLDLFLGCRSNLADWFVNLIRAIASRYPNEVVFRNAISFFEDVCNNNRLELLRL